MTVLLSPSSTEMVLVLDIKDVMSFVSIGDGKGSWV
jgi:hypothetical protein